MFSNHPLSASPVVHRAQVFIVAQGLPPRDSGETRIKLPIWPGWHAGRPMACRPDNRQGGADSHRLPPMTPQNPQSPRARIAPAGLMFLAITSVSWGFNWPINKYLLSELPPLTTR